MRWLHSLEHVLLLKLTQVWFPAPMGLLTESWNSNPRESHAIFLPSQAPKYAYTHVNFFLKLFMSKKNLLNHSTDFLLPYKEACNLRQFSDLSTDPCTGPTPGTELQSVCDVCFSRYVNHLCPVCTTTSKHLTLLCSFKLIFYVSNLPTVDTSPCALKH